MLFSTDLSYQNNYTKYENDTPSVTSPSLASYLNELDNSIFLNLNYQYEPDLSFLVGYQFALNDYTANQPIGIGAVDGIPVGIYNSGNLNNYQQNIYLGAKYNANENLDATAQAGATYVDNYNLPSFSTQASTSWYPYANVALTYTYLPGCYAQLGFTEDVGTSDTPNPSQTNGSITTYQLTSVLYGTINHKITPDLTASVIGRWQYGIYQGGASDGTGQAWYSVGVNLSYQLNLYLSAEAGVNYDYVATTTALPGYHRAVTYLGITAAY
jgi:hypothetical protein